MLKAMRHRILTTAAFALLTLLSVEASSKRPSETCTTETWGNAVRGSTGVKPLPAIHRRHPTLRKLTTTIDEETEKKEEIYSAALGCKPEYQTVDAYHSVKRQEEELGKKIDIQNLMDEKTFCKERVMSHVTTQYYDTFFGDGEIRHKVDKGFDNDIFYNVDEPSKDVTIGATFKINVSSQRNATEKIRAAINGGGCYGKVEPSHAGRLLRDSAGNIFLKNTAGEKLNVNVTLYVPTLFVTSVSNHYDALDETISELFTAEYKPAQWDAINKFDNKDWNTEMKFGSWLKKFITTVRYQYEDGYKSDEGLCQADPDAFCRDMMIKKYGVCRHRAYLVAHVLNEIGVKCVYARGPSHAWVEIQGANKQWACIDLGGGSALSRDGRQEYEAKYGSKTSSVMSVSEGKDRLLIQEVILSNGIDENDTVVHNDEDGWKVVDFVVDGNEVKAYITKYDNGTEHNAVVDLKDLKKSDEKKVKFEEKEAVTYKGDDGWIFCSPLDNGAAQIMNKETFEMKTVPLKDLQKVQQQTKDIIAEGDAVIYNGDGNWIVQRMWEEMGEAFIQHSDGETKTVLIGELNLKRD